MNTNVRDQNESKTTKRSIIAKTKPFTIPMVGSQCAHLYMIEKKASVKDAVNLYLDVMLMYIMSSRLA